MSVSVGVPSLDSLTIAQNGGGVMTVTGVKAQSFSVTVAGSGLVQASGTATRLVVSLGGSGDVELDQLLARDVQAVVSGAGRIAVTATGSLRASVHGSGVIQYLGNPAPLVTNVTGDGVILPG